MTRTALLSHIALVLEQYKDAHPEDPASRQILIVSYDGDNDSGELIIDALNAEGEPVSFIIRADDVAIDVAPAEAMLAPGRAVTLTTGEDGHILQAFEHDRTYNVVISPGSYNNEFVKRAVREDDIDHEWEDTDDDLTAEEIAAALRLYRLD